MRVNWERKLIKKTYQERKNKKWKRKYTKQ